MERRSASTAVAPATIRIAVPTGISMRTSVRPGWIAEGPAPPAPDSRTMPKKSQVSFEVLIVLAIGMLVGAPLLMYANREGPGSQETAAASGMDQLCGAIVERAEAMEGMGRESWSTITFRAGTPVLAVRPRSKELTLEAGGEGGPM